MGRRWKIVRVSRDLLTHMLMTGVKPAVEVRDGLPPDAEFDAAHYDVERGEFLLRFRSESFPETPEGCAILTLLPTVHQADMDAQLADAFARGAPAAECRLADTPAVVGGESRG